ncbi:MAG TPA: response regulator transcription factor [Steroidobacteraceae bacterium]|jgi:two-component system OmpR family response regulator|nr:response regulator transcription factor [Steroidobacteraceae bacterium]
MKVLLVEDDAETAAYICAGLGAQGIDVQHVADGTRGRALAAAGHYEALILDRRLPGIDGLSLLQGLRSAGVRTPALYLTAMDGLDDRIEGLEAGGDDYLIKPFFLGELHARLRALVRRSTAEVQTRLRVGDIELDLIARRAMRAGEELPLLPQELKLLEYLMRNAGSIVTRSMLLEHVWDIHFDPQTSVVESHMSRLRAKLSPGGGREYIRTARGAGYVFVIQSAAR